LNFKEIHWKKIRQNAAWGKAATTTHKHHLGTSLKSPVRHSKTLQHCAVEDLYFWPE